jgi:hypothetical protein
MKAATKKNVVEKKGCTTLCCESLIYFNFRMGFLKTPRFLMALIEFFQILTKITTNFIAYFTFCLHCDHHN